jgi:hypothetical protein
LVATDRYETVHNAIGSFDDEALNV